MGNEVAVAAPPKPPIRSGGQIAAFVPQTIEEAYRLSQALAQSQMTPKSYGNDPNKIMVGIMAGAEVGLTPFASLQSIAVIGNNPSLWGDGALAVVQASGLLEDIDETDDGQMATCRLVRQGRTSPIVRTFSMEDAKKAGLAGKAGPWTQYPKRMRQMRARAFALRDGFADVLKGLRIAEEVRDYGPSPDEADAPQVLTGAMLIEQARPAADTRPMGEVINDEIPTFDADTREVQDEPTRDPQTGMTEISEEAARELDQRQAAEQTLRDIDGPMDEAGEAEAVDEEHPAQKKLRFYRERLDAAKTKQDVTGIEADFLKERAVFDDEDAQAMDRLIHQRAKALPNEGAK